MVSNSEYQNYRILNNLGQLVYLWQSNSKVQNIALENVLHTPGLYILQAQNSSGNHISRKFIYTK